MKKWDEPFSPTSPGEPPAKPSVEPMNFPKCNHLTPSLSQADAARAEVVRTSEMCNDTLAAIGLGPFLADDKWFLSVAAPATQRVCQSVQRVTDLLPALFNLDVVLSRHHRREVDPTLG